MSERPGGSSDRSRWTKAEWTAHRHELNRKLRAAFLAGAEERSRAERGRGLTESEVLRLSWDYPGDLPTDISEPDIF